MIIHLMESTLWYFKISFEHREIYIYIYWFAYESWWFFSIMWQFTRTQLSMSGWWFRPSPPKNMSSAVGSMKIPTEWKHVPNISKPPSRCSFMARHQYGISPWNIPMEYPHGISPCIYGLNMGFKPLPILDTLQEMKFLAGGRRYKRLAKEDSGFSELKPSSWLTNSKQPKMT